VLAYRAWWCSPSPSTRRGCTPPTARARHVGEVFEIFKATVTATLILVAVTYFTRDRYSRLTLGIFVGYSFVGVSAAGWSFAPP